MEAYKVLAGPFSREIDVLKSRFVCDLAAADSIDSAQAMIAEVRARYPDATHHCYAFVVGPPGSTARIGQSDDGEPHGTAGRPMLNVLLHGGVGDVVAVVTRYFGGTKLGKGGLARAYSDAVQAALDEAPTTLRVDWVAVAVTADYAFVDGLHRLYPGHEAELLEESFAAGLTHRLRLPRPKLADFERALGDATRGQAKVEVVEDG